MEMIYLFNGTEIEKQFVYEFPCEALDQLLKQGKTYEEISTAWGNNEDNQVPILQPVEGNDNNVPERYIQKIYEDNNSKKFFLTNQWGRKNHALPRWETFINGCAELGLTIIEKQKNNSCELNQILYGPPGTGKTYSTVNLALEVLDRTGKHTEINSIKKLKEKFPKQVEFVTFHQSFSYEDFVEGLKAESDGGNLSYSVEDGVFKLICENAKTSGNNSLEELDKAIEKLKEQVEEGSLELKTKAQKKKFSLTYNGGNSFYAKPEAGTYDNPVSIESIRTLYINPDVKSGEEGVHFKIYTTPVIEYLNKRFNIPEYHHQTDNKPHVLIIDEINRGNISRIFGELITLIESSKRAGEDEEISVTLPYSKEFFSVPSNLYIIGTMNTADRSLALMDTALRRRFDFIELMPNSSLVPDNIEGVNVKLILDEINRRIEVLYDREHTIGHAFLMKVKNLDNLRHAFKNKILPLLEEYFYDDWEKIRLVLADENQNFYKVLKKDDDIFSGMGDDYKDQIKYKRKKIMECSREAFIQIYKLAVVTNAVDEGE